MILKNLGLGPGFLFYGSGPCQFYPESATLGDQQTNEQFHGVYLTLKYIIELLT